MIKLKTFGNKAPNCPHCNYQLEKMLTRKKKCPSCEKDIYKRTCPVSEVPVLVTKIEAELIEEQWAIKDGVHEDYLKEKNKIKQLPIRSPSPTNYLDSLPLLINYLNSPLWKEYQFELEYMSGQKINKLKKTYKTLPKREVTAITRDLKYIFESIEETSIYEAMAEFVETDIENDEWDVNTNNENDLIRSKEEQEIYDLALSLPDETLIKWGVSSSEEADPIHALYYGKTMTLGEAKKLNFQSNDLDGHGKKCKCELILLDKVADKKVPKKKKGFFSKLFKLLF